MYEHEIPGGQYTNLLFQSRQQGGAGHFGAIKRAYAAANVLLGDIPKATPSSKVRKCKTRGSNAGDLVQDYVRNGMVYLRPLASTDSHTTGCRRSCTIYGS